MVTENVQGYGPVPKFESYYDREFFILERGVEVVGKRLRLDNLPCLILGNKSFRRGIFSTAYTNFNGGITFHLSRIVHPSQDSPENCLKGIETVASEGRNFYEHNGEEPKEYPIRIFVQDPTWNPVVEELKRKYEMK